MAEHTWTMIFFGAKGSGVWLVKKENNRKYDNSFNFHGQFKALKAKSLRELLATGRPLKIVKNIFYFTSKALSILKIFKFLS